MEDLGIHIGAVVTYQDGFEELANDYYVGRAFDNRVGGFMIAEVARLLKENKKTLPFGLYIVNAVQEEVGLRGAEMIARRIKPDVAIVTGRYPRYHNTDDQQDHRGRCILRQGPKPCIWAGSAQQAAGFCTGHRGKK